MQLLNSLLLLSLTGLIVIAQNSGPSEDEVNDALQRAEEIMESFVQPVTINTRIATGIATRNSEGRDDDSPTAKHNLQQAGDIRSLEMNANQLVYEEASRILQTAGYSSDQISAASAQFVQVSESVPPECDQNYLYRSFDGTCNNFNHPNWGKATYCFNRLMRAVYSDHRSKFRKAVSGKELPKPRQISLNVHSLLDRPDVIWTHMTMQWGQFLDHDFSLTPTATDANDEELQCCVRNHPQCGVIEIEKDDPFYSQYGIRCLPNPRSQICQLGMTGPREQTKRLTSYIDASMVYGNSLIEANELRVLNDQKRKGELKSFHDKNVGELLPPDVEHPFCTPKTQNGNRRCFLAGDIRANQNPGLTSLHTIFVRLHNQIVRFMRKSKPSLSGEKLYQQARRLVGAIVQVISYGEFLPIIIGDKAMEENGLTNTNTIYDPNIDATLLNEFSTAAFRFGHSTVNQYQEESAKFGSGGFELRDLFFFPYGLYDGQLSSVSKGLCMGPMQGFDRFMIKDLTNHLFQTRGKNSSYGLDLAAINVFRGRDHGLPPYIDVVKFCGGPTIRTFSDLANSGLFSNETTKLFRNVYESPKDIDLFSGGLAEATNQKEAVVGPTFNCIISEQFARLKYGDRFFFEHYDQPTSFTEEQRNEIRQVTLAKVMCLTLDLKEIQQFVMTLPGQRNPIVSCSDLGAINIDLFTEF